MASKDDQESIGLGTQLEVEADRKTIERFLEAARRSGLVDKTCERCTRSFLTRSEDPRCPPCRSGKPDGWTPAHTRRHQLLGAGKKVPGYAECFACSGLGVVGWVPGGQASPWCSCCDGLGLDVFGGADDLY